MTFNHQPSEKVENFLKAVYALQQQAGEGMRVSTNTLSEVLNITAPSVTDMAQRLVTAGLIDYRKYHGVLLTADGEAIALRVLRRHRLLETYLVTELGYALAQVHDEAERLEHAVSDHFIEAIAFKLGNPIFDPHGDPIPTAQGTVIVREQIPLSELPEGVRAAISQLKASGQSMLTFIIERGFKLGAEVEVIARDPFDGPVTVELDGERRVIGSNITECIFVEK